MPYDPKQAARNGYSARTGQPGATREDADAYIRTAGLSRALRAFRAEGKVNPHVLDSAAAAAEQLEQRATAAGLHVREPLTYERRSPHSFFKDLLSITCGRGDPAAAGQRLAAHGREMNRVMPPWREARKRLADAAYEATLASDWRGQQALDRMERLGVSRFTPGNASTERRAVNSTAGTGGNFVPPLWLTQLFVDAPRAGAPFARMVTGLPLALHTGGTISVPRWTTGTGAGPQSDGGPVPSSSAADSYSTTKVLTIAGSQSVSSFWAEQAAPPGADEFIFRDLLEDMDAGLDAQLLIGSGSGGQLTGVIPSGTAAAASLVWSKSTNNTASQTWIASSADTPAWTAVPQLFPLMAKGRGLQPDLLIVSPATWAQVTSLLDTGGRPIVLPCADPPVPGQVVQLWGRPALVHETLPDTFGGATAPYITTSGGGVTAVTDGTGTWSVVAAVRPADLVLFEGEVQTEVMPDVLSGTLQYRFAARAYHGFLRDRYTAAAAISASNSGDVSGSASAGASVSCGVFTNYTSNSPMQPAASGF